MKKYLTIFLNLLFVIASAILLITEYQRVGHFQWVDQNAIEDHEELYFNPICAAIVVFGIIAITGLVLNTPKRHRSYIVQVVGKFIINPLSTIYAIFIFFVGLIFSLMIFGNIPNTIHDFKDAISVFMVIFIFAVLAVTGLLTLIQLHAIKPAGNSKIIIF